MSQHVSDELRKRAHQELDAVLDEIEGEIHNIFIMTMEWKSEQDGYLLRHTAYGDETTLIRAIEAFVEEYTLMVERRKKAH